jgi:hypothetical protein
MSMVDLDWTMLLLAIIVIQLFCIARTLAAIFAAVLRLYKHLDTEAFQKADLEPWETARANAAVSASKL